MAKRKFTLIGSLKGTVYGNITSIKKEWYERTFTNTSNGMSCRVWRVKEKAGDCCTISDGGIRMNRWTTRYKHYVLNDKGLNEIMGHIVEERL